MGTAQIAIPGRKPESDNHSAILPGGAANRRRPGGPLLVSGKNGPTLVRPLCGDSARTSANHDRSRDLRTARGRAAAGLKPRPSTSRTRTN